MGSSKSIALMRTAKEAIKRRLSTYSFVESVDATNTNPVMVISADATPAAGEQVAVVRISPVALLFTNGIGGTQENMTPHYVDICLETSTIAAVALLTQVNQSNIIAEFLKLGAIVRIYMTANNTVPTAADVLTQMVPANLISTFQLDQSHFLMGA